MFKFGGLNSPPSPRCCDL